MKPRFVILALLFHAGYASADEVVFYRCTDDAGALTLQNMPCPKGHKQEKKIMQSVSTLPMAPATGSKPVVAAPAMSGVVQAVAATPVVTSQTPVVTSNPTPAAQTTATATSTSTPTSTDAPVTAQSDRLPPPVLFQCVTYDKDTYVTEEAETPARCVPMQTVGLDGDPQTGAGEACEMKRDECARVADGALCDAWKKRVGETEVAWRFARAGNEQKNKAEFERTRRILTESTCGK